MKSQVPLGFILLDNRLTIDYIMNWTYIFEPVKRWLIQVNCLLNLRYEFKYDMAVNIIRYKDGLIYAFNAQAVNHLSPYSGFRFHYLKIRILSLQSRTNPLRLSSLKVRVWGSAFSADEYLVLNLLMGYITVDCRVNLKAYCTHFLYCPVQL